MLIKVYSTLTCIPIQHDTIEEISCEKFNAISIPKCFALRVTKEHPHCPHSDLQYVR